ncbi:uncharacterized protein B0P05DRAFT_639478 [Gilbertella persicaria]|uniref:Uncharacterized protein n=1 Tax=Rhizopus stolonifer TaxID=4846 RepID=A0A367K8R2_RHIST|nr:uncharacterized protein B0P05DRAFT_639478 [Gilbertella persicaria]KAI8069106.1 hypothetical protein B0P05DRAFT_639478 [Gilbertella persicaria]RCH98604.1 hypothetical protein CU098_011070 [Rhizopus stolonifer]
MNSSCCDKNRLEIQQLRSELKGRELEVRRYKILEIKFHNERNQMQCEKDLADRELEELSIQLFEEANRMVVEEKQKRVQLETLLCIAQDHLAELKSNMVKVVIPPPRSSSLPALFDKIDVHNHDQAQLALFHNFIDSTKNNRCSSSSYGSCGTQNDYMTQCEKEDIEPCLLFGNSESRMNMQEMMLCMAQEPCLIESVKWEDQPMVCATCSRQVWGRLYRFRLGSHDPWLMIDGGCRDRLVAVCDFYSFVRNVQLGHIKHKSLDALYMESVELRKRMFYARMGFPLT